LTSREGGIILCFNATERRRGQLGRTAVDSALDLIDRHFAAENAHDIDATLATYTDDILWDDVTHPRSPFRGKQAVAGAYGGILDAIPDLHLRSVLRFECGDHVVDESILTGHVVGEFAGIAGGGAPVSFRLLHIFDIRDGLIARENAWFDSAAVVRQVREFSNRPIR
jgi:steroid delta-isomerase-like uncharacterized protein